MSAVSVPLARCSLTVGDVSPGLGTFAGRIDHQARRLGLDVANDGARLADGLDFTLHTPFTSPVRCEWRNWAGGPGPGSGEILLQAASGLMSVHGRASGGARPLGVDYVSTLASVLALNGAIACALGQLRGGDFPRCHGTLLGAALLAVGQYLADATVPDRSGYLPAVQAGTGRHPPFLSADGVRFELEALDAGPWLRFWLSAGVTAEEAGQGWTTFLWRYARAVAPQPEALLAAAAALPFSHLCGLARTAGMALSRLRSPAEREADAEEIGLQRRGPWEFAFSAALPRAERAGKPEALPLDGLTVLESCRRIQGPLAGHLLAMLGARVIRIEPPGGDPLRGMPPLVDGCSVRFDALNRLKVVREIDLKSADGRAVLKSLVCEADVFLHNWAPGKAAAFGLDHGDLLALNPALVYAQAAGWDDEAGHGLPGTDFMAQAHTGVAEVIAAASGSRGGTLFTALDVLGGAVTAQGITAALFARRIGRCGARVRTSLAGAASLLRTVPSRPAAFRGVFPTAAGALALDCRDAASQARLASALGGVPGEDMATLAIRLSMKSVDDWLPCLDAADVPAVRVIEDLAGLSADPSVRPLLGGDTYSQVNSPWSFPS